ncbi:hypothetical protein JQR85_05675 [Stutzerimonas urumqiensis]|uniref:hypothetical protein n=1 Tax=Stutzerimonas urumqiensis TaxID=638269 RepID=UPI000EAB70B7|nr:hypothetical protein [Stutzerimonas urumqiensis]
MATPDEEITGYGGQPQTGSYTGHQQTGTTSTASSGSGQSSHATPATEDLKLKARQAGDQVKAQGRAQIDRYRGTAADEIEKVAQSARAAATELENQDRPGLSQYVTSAAEYMVEFADDLRQKNVDELFSDVNRMARNNPGLFIAGAVALGFGAMRFARASSHRAHVDDYGTHRHDGHDHDEHAHHFGDSGHLPSQHELDRHLDSGVGGRNVGSVSNAGAADLSRGMGTTSTSTTTTSTTTSTTGSLGASSTTTRPVTGTSATTSTRPTTGTGTTTGQGAKGNDGGLLP